MLDKVISEKSIGSDLDVPEVIHANLEIDISKIEDRVETPE